MQSATGLHQPRNGAVAGRPDLFGKSSPERSDDLFEPAYEMVRGQNNLNSTCELCWDQPFDLHQIRDRHFAMFKEEHHTALKELVSLRAIFKFIEVVKPAPKNDAVERKAAEVTNEVKNLFETRMAQYNRASTLDASSTTCQCR
jgi:hypothetical protein